jgi:hypothetical protein
MENKSTSRLLIWAAVLLLVALGLMLLARSAQSNALAAVGLVVLVVAGCCGVAAMTD